MLVTAEPVDIEPRQHLLAEVPVLPSNAENTVPRERWDGERREVGVEVRVGDERRGAKVRRCGRVLVQEGERIHRQEMLAGSADISGGVERRCRVKQVTVMAQGGADERARAAREKLVPCRCPSSVTAPVEGLTKEKKNVRDSHIMSAPQTSVALSASSSPSPCATSRRSYVSIISVRRARANSSRCTARQRFGEVELAAALDVPSSDSSDDPPTACASSTAESRPDIPSTSRSIVLRTASAHMASTAHLSGPLSLSASAYSLLLASTSSQGRNTGVLLLHVAQHSSRRDHVTRRGQAGCCARSEDESVARCA